MRLPKLRSLGLPLLLAGASTTVASGCADNQTTFFVYHVIGVDDSCEVDADLGSASFGQGRLDLAATEDGYEVSLLLANQLRPLVGKDNLKTETSYITVQGVEVTVTSTSGGGGVEFTQPLSATVPPNSGAEPGTAAITFVALPKEVAEAGESYLVEMIVFGETLGGLGVESPPFVYPIEVTEGDLCVEPGDPRLDFDGPGSCTSGQDNAFYTYVGNSGCP